MSRKYFGTDGVRGRVGEAPISRAADTRAGMTFCMNRMVSSPWDHLKREPRQKADCVQAPASPHRRSASACKW